MRAHIFVISFFFFSTSFGQVNKSDPANIGEAIEFLSKDVPQELKAKIKITSEDSLMSLFAPWGGNYFGAAHWTYDSAKLNNYYSKFGIESVEFQTTITLLAFKTYLNNQVIDTAKLLKPFQEIEEKREFEYERRFTADSLWGIYIPTDLNDCFIQLDKRLKDSLKNVIKGMSEREFGSKSHLGLGMWLRNNWKLWTGSRLSKYFNDMGVNGADNISGIILLSYHRHLTGKAIMLEKQIEDFKYDRKIFARPDSSLLPTSVLPEDYYMSRSYKKSGGEEGMLHFYTNGSTNEYWVYDYFNGWAKINTSDKEFDKALTTQKKVKSFFKKHRL